MDRCKSKLHKRPPPKKKFPKSGNYNNPAGKKSAMGIN